VIYKTGFDPAYIRIVACFLAACWISTACVIRQGYIILNVDAALFVIFVTNHDALTKCASFY